MTALYEPVDQSRFASVAELAGLHGPRFAWRAFAACRGQDLALFFPDCGSHARQAKAICARCPVADICLDVALRNNEHDGIWGGKSERERRALRAGRFSGLKADVLEELERMPGGRWKGSAIGLAEHMGQGATQVARAVGQLAKAGLVTVERPHPKAITAITLNKETPAP